MRLIGLEKQLSEFENWLKNWDLQQKKAVILWSEGPGRGKTQSVYYIARKLGYKVIEFNASIDRKKEFFDRKLKPLCMSKTLVKSIVLLDEAELIPNKAMNSLRQIIEKTKIPIVLTTNDIQSLAKIRDLCHEIYYPKPLPQVILEVAKMHGVKQGFSKFSNVTDLRQLELMIKHGSEGYNFSRALARRARLHKSVTTGKYVLEGEEDLIWLMDTFFGKLKGLDLIVAIEFVQLANVRRREDEGGEFNKQLAEQILKGLRFKLREDEIKETFFTLQRREGQ